MRMKCAFSSRPLQSAPRNAPSTQFVLRGGRAVGTPRALSVGAEWQSGWLLCSFVIGSIPALISRRRCSSRPTAAQRFATSFSAVLPALVEAPEDRFADVVEVEVHVAPGLTLKVLEASLDWQERLIEKAIEAPESSVDVDPYGMALWPAAQVLAQVVAAYGEALMASSAPGNQPRVLELGAGCGLASLTAAAVGLDVVATDFRRLPLELLHESALRQGLGHRVRTELLDVRDHKVPLPEADIVMASDVLYERETAEAMARRVAEARGRGSTVIFTDIGRPNRKAFLQELQRLLPEEALLFQHHGVAEQATYQDSADLKGLKAREIKVEVLELPMQGVAARALLSRCVLLRPPSHGHVL